MWWLKMQGISSHIIDLFIGLMISHCCWSILLTLAFKPLVYFEGLVQDCSNSSADVLELLQSFTKPSIWSIYKQNMLDFSFDLAYECLLNHLFRHRWKKSLKLCVTGFFEGNSSHWWPVNSTHTRAVTRKMFPFDDVIMVMCNQSFEPDICSAGSNTYMCISLVVVILTLWCRDT